MSRFKLDTNLVVLLLGAVVLWFMPPALGMGSYQILVVSIWLVMSIAAMGLNLTLGYAGQVSLAQAAFLGIGAYTTAILMTKYGFPWWSCFLLSGALSFLVGIVLGFPALRVQHHYLAFITLAFASVVWLIFRNEQAWTGGVQGISGIARSDILGIKIAAALPFFRFILCVTVVLTLVMWWLVKSPWGRAFQALRENPVRAASIGVDVRAYTLLAFAIGSAYGGFAGSLYAPLIEFIDPSPFTVAASLTLLLTVVVGGSGYFLAPFLGALVSFALPEWLRFTGGWYLLIFAAFVLALLIICPQGLMGLAERWYVAVKHLIRPPVDTRVAVIQAEGETK